MKSYLDRYCYPRRSDPRFIVFEADDARYMNHADDPNFGFLSEDEAVALRDIAAGEELTCDYNVILRRRLRVPRRPLSDRQEKRNRFRKRR